MLLNNEIRRRENPRRCTKLSTAWFPVISRNSQFGGWLVFPGPFVSSISCSWEPALVRVLKWFANIDIARLYIRLPSFVHTKPPKVWNQSPKLPARIWIPFTLPDSVGSSFAVVSTSANTRESLWSGQSSVVHSSGWLLLSPSRGRGILQGTSLTRFGSGPCVCCLWLGDIESSRIVEFNHDRVDFTESNV